MLKTNKELEERFAWLYNWKDAPENVEYSKWPVQFNKRFQDEKYKNESWGWNNLLWELMEEIERIDKDKATVIFQIKEKFGGLRFYVGFRKEINDVDRRIINKCISRTENISFSICEVCGNCGKKRSGGWIKTLCDKHHQERKECRRR